jgi:hypothetical protein
MLSVSSYGLTVRIPHVTSRRELQIFKLFSNICLTTVVSEIKSSNLYVLSRPLKIFFDQFIFSGFSNIFPPHVPSLKTLTAIRFSSIRSLTSHYLFLYSEILSVILICNIITSLLISKWNSCYWYQRNASSTLHLLIMSNALHHMPECSNHYNTQY